MSRERLTHAVTHHSEGGVVGDHSSGRLFSKGTWGIVRFGRETSTLRLIILSTILALAVVGLSGVAVADDPEAITECSEIDESGVYALNADLAVNQTSDACLQVTADDIIIEGNGYAIQSSSHLTSNADLGDGIDVDDGVANLTIQNVTFVDLRTAIRAGHPENITIHGNEFSEEEAEAETGIRFTGEIDGASITNNTIEAWDELVFTSSADFGDNYPVDIYIANNTASDSRWSFAFDLQVIEIENAGPGSTVVIENNEFYDSIIEGGQPADIRLNSVVGNATVKNNYHQGADSSVYRFDSVDNLHAEGNVIDYEGGGTGFFSMAARSSTEGLFVNNEIRDTYQNAIRLQADNVTVRNDTYTDVGGGVDNTGENNTVLDTVVDGTMGEDYQGFALRTTDPLTVENFTYNNVTVSGELAYVALTDFTDAFDSAADFEGIDEPLEGPEHDSLGIYANLTRTSSVSEPYADLSWSYATADVGDDDALSLLRYDHVDEQWVTLDAVTTNTTEETISANVTDLGTVGIYELPEPTEASFSTNIADPMMNEEVTFDASDSSATDGVEEYHWSFNDGTEETTTDPQITHSFESGGTFDVELTIDDGYGLSAVTTEPLEVSAPGAAFEWDPLYPGPNETISFDASDSTTPATEIETYHWTFDDGTTETTNESTIEHTFSDTGEYDVELEVVDDVGNENLTTESTLVTEPGDAFWQVETDGSVASSPAKSDGVIFAGTSENTLYATDAASGEEVWTFETEDRIYSSPAVADGLVFIGDDDGNVYAVNETTGEEVWSESTGWRDSVDSELTVADGTVFVTTTNAQGTSSGSVNAFDVETGESEWTFDTGTDVAASPTVVDGTVYVGKIDGTFYSLDAETGDEEWSVETDNSVRSTATVHDGTVYFGSDDGNVYALDASTGDEDWSYAVGEMVRSQPAIDDGTLYVGSSDRNVYALDANTGSVEWREGTDDNVESGPAVVDDTVYIGSHDGSLYALSAATGAQLWQFETDSWIDSSPLVVDDVAYIGSRDDTIAAINARSVTNLRTVADFGYSPSLNPEPDEAITFDASSSTHPDNDDIVEYRWDFTDDGTHDIITSNSQASWTFEDGHDKHVTLEVESEGGDTAILKRAVPVDGVIWSYATLNRIHSSPTVVDGTVYVGNSGADNSLYAIDEQTGEVEWVFEADHDVRTAPAVTDEMVYIGSRDDHVYAVNRSTGDEEWSYDAGGLVYSSPTISDGLVYFGSANDNVTALDKHTGQEEWTFETGASVPAAPTIVDGTVYIGSYDDHLYAIDADTGDEVWSEDTGYSITAAATVAGDYVYVGSGSSFPDDNRLYAFNRFTGDEAWSHSAENRLDTPPTVANGTVYYGDNNGFIYALDVASGDEEWTIEIEGGTVQGAPTVAGDLVYITTSDEFLAINSDTGSIEWVYEPPYATGLAFRSSSPIVVDGTLYVGSDQGTMYALDATVDGSSVDTLVLQQTLGHHDYPVGAEFAVDPDEPMADTVTTFDAGDSTAPYGIDEYQWDFGDGTTETTNDSVIEHTFDDPDSYDVSLTIVSDGTVVDTRTETLEVGEPVPSPAFEWEPPNPEPGDTVDFDASNSTTPADSIVEYSWDWGDGTADTSAGPTIAHTYTESGSYEVELEVEDEAGYTETVTETVHVADSGEAIWRTELDWRAGQSSPTVVNDTAYMQDDDGTIWAIDVDTGEEEWSVEGYQQPRNDDSPTVIDDVLYVGTGFSGNAHVRAFNASTGEELWASPLDRERLQAAGTTVHGDTVYVPTLGEWAFSGGVNNGFVLAFDRHTGELEWEYETTAQTRTEPVVSDGQVYVGDRIGTTYALDANTGDEQWTHEGPTRITHAPAVEDGVVYVGADDVIPDFGADIARYEGQVYALDAETGDELWDDPYVDDEERRGITTALTVDDGQLFFGGGDDEIIAIDTADGSEAWSVPTDSWVRSSPTVADGQVFVGDNRGVVYSITADTGVITWMHYEENTSVESSPTVADGVAYVAIDHNYKQFPDPDELSDVAELLALDAGVDASSSDSRVIQAVLGHHDVLQPYFEVEILSSNAPVLEGEDLEFEVQVSNTGMEDTQTVEVEDHIGNTGSAEVTLDTGEQTTVNITVETEEGTASYGDAEARSADATDTEEVAIQQDVEINSCEELDTPGVYTKTGGHATSQTCLEITSSYVEVTGSVSVVGQSPDPEQYGIHINGEDGELRNVVVHDMHLTGWTTMQIDKGAMYIENVTDSEIRGVSVADSYWGIWGEDITNTEFRDNDFGGVTWYGMQLHYASNNTFVGNEMPGPYYGLTLADGSDDNTLVDNEFAGTNYGFSSLESSGNTLENTDARYNFGDVQAPQDLGDFFSSEGGAHTATNYTISDGSDIWIDSVDADHYEDEEIFASGEATVDFEAVPNPDITLDFEASNVDFTAVTSPAANDEASSLGQYVQVHQKGGPSWFDVAVHYDEEHLDGADATDLSLWLYTDGEWSELNDTTVDTNAETVATNLTDVGTLGVFVDDPDADPDVPVTEDLEGLTLEAQHEETNDQHEWEATHVNGTTWNVTLDADELEVGDYNMWKTTHNVYGSSHSVNLETDLNVTAQPIPTATLEVEAFGDQLPAVEPDPDIGTLDIDVAAVGEPTENLEITLEVREPLATSPAHEETIGDRTLDNESDTFTFDVGEIDVGDSWTVSVTADADNARPVTVTEGETSPDWSQFGGDETNTGVTDDAGPLENVSESWVFPTFDAVESSPAVVDGMVFVGSEDGYVYSLTEEGELLWSYEAGGPVSSSPTVSDGVVYVGVERDDGPDIVAIDATNGSEVWSTQTGEGFGQNGVVRSSPTVVDGTVYIGNSGHSYDVLYALDAMDGSIEWSADIDGSIESSPALVDGTVYVGTTNTNNGVFGVDASTGEPEELQGSGSSRSSAAIDDGVLYIGAAFSVYAIDLETGTELWSFRAESQVWSSPAIEGDTVYVGSNDGHLYAIDADPTWTDGDAEEGDHKWRVETGEDVTSSPTVADGVIYVGSEDGTVYAIDDDGTVQWEYETDNGVRSSPAVVDGTVYVGSDDGHLYALEEEPGEIPTGSVEVTGQITTETNSVNVSVSLDELEDPGHLEVQARETNGTASVTINESGTYTIDIGELGVLEAEDTLEVALYETAEMENRLAVDSALIAPPQPSGEISIDDPITEDQDGFDVTYGFNDTSYGSAMVIVGNVDTEQSDFQMVSTNDTRTIDVEDIGGIEAGDEIVAQLMDDGEMGMGTAAESEPTEEPTQPGLIDMDSTIVDSEPSDDPAPLPPPPSPSPTPDPTEEVDADLIGPGVVLVEAGEISAGTPVEISIPQEDDWPVELEQVDFTVQEDTNLTFEIRTDVEPPTDDASPFERADGTEGVSYHELDHSIPDDAVTGVEFHFRMKTDVLEDDELEDVALYRLEDGDWSELETELSNETDSHVWYDAVSPGLSEFVTGIKQPQFEISDAVVDVTELSVGDSTQIEVSITNTGGADGTFTAQLLIDGDLVEEQDLTIAEGGTRQTTFDQTFDEAGSYEVIVNDVSSGEVEVTATDEDDGIGLTPIIGAILVIVVIAVAGVFVLQQREAGPFGSETPSDDPGGDDSVGGDTAVADTNQADPDESESEGPESELGEKADEKGQITEAAVTPQTDGEETPDGEDGGRSGGESEPDTESTDQAEKTQPEGKGLPGDESDENGSGTASASADDEPADVDDSSVE